MKKKHLLAFLGNWENMQEEHRERDEDFYHHILEAKEEWNHAQNFFENVSDPDLVDYAIYRLEAARIKYRYLLKQARLQGMQTQASGHLQGKAH